MTSGNLVPGQHRREPAESRVERHEADDAHQADALRHAAELGWSDVASGRFIDISDDGLDEFITQLGVRAQSRPAG